MLEIKNQQRWGRLKLPHFLWSREQESEECLYRKDDSNAVIYL